LRHAAPQKNRPVALFSIWLLVRMIVRPQSPAHITSTRSIRGRPLREHAGQ